MNKPLAWMRESDKDCVSDKVKNELLEEEGKDWNYVIPLYTNPVKELTGILATIKCIADDISGHKDYENTYSDGWIDACNTVYDEVFAILRKAQDIKYDVTIKWDDKTTHHEDVSGDTPLHHTNPAELTDEEIEILKEIIRITDRKHPLWDKAKEFLK